MFSETTLPTVEGRVSTKLLRREELQSKSSKDVPKSYIQNSDGEKNCLELIQNSTRRILNDNPDIDPRCMAMISVENEFGTTKCCCTTIKPELLPHPCIHSIDECSQFVAHYFDYEPLEQACEPPSYLPSPTQVITWGVGDAFDLAVLLASFLIGGGFDAYVAYGSAPLWMCQRDRSRTSLTRREKKLHFSSSAEIYMDSDEEIKTIKAELLGLAFGCNDPSRLCWGSQYGETETLEQAHSVGEADDLERKEMHCFVLVQNKIGTQFESSNILIDPSTGLTYKCADDEINLFAVWNDANYWMNINKSEKKLVDLQSDNWVPFFEKSNKPYSLPNSWVQKVCIPRKSFEFAYPPDGQRSFQLHKAKIEMYSEGIHDHGLLHRSITYQDEGKIQVVDSLEYFGRNRKDNMTRRLRMPLDMCTREDYSSGNTHFLKTWIEIMGSKRMITFRLRGRSDGLSRYYEIFGSQIEHTFSNRRDCLLRRITFVKRVDGFKEKLKKGRLILSSTDGAQNLMVTNIVYVSFTTTFAISFIKPHP